MTNSGAYQGWIKTTHRRTQFKQIAFCLVEMTTDESGENHKDLRTSGLLLNRQMRKYVLVPLQPMSGSLDGMLLKCEKAKLMNHFTEAQDAPNPPPPRTTMIGGDDNALFHCLGDLLKGIKDISGKILDSLSVTSQVVLSTYLYQEVSIIALVSE